MPSQTSHVQPLPKRFTPPSLTAERSSSNEPNVSSIAERRAPPGSPPPSGLMIDQKSSWFACPPALFRTAVRNNAGGHANHTLFWSIMSPDGGGEPGGELRAAIDDAVGSFDDLKSAINDAGVKRFGSGWSWLVWDGTGLEVYSTPNQDSPLMQSHVPLLGVDVWEHAYYLKYQNKRAAYLEAWWSVVSWPEVERRFAAARNG